MGFPMGFPQTCSDQGVSLLAEASRSDLRPPLLQPEGVFSHESAIFEQKPWKNIGKHWKSMETHPADMEMACLKMHNGVPCDKVYPQYIVIKQWKN